MKIIDHWNKQQLLATDLFEPLHPVIAELPADKFPDLTDFNQLLTQHQPAITTQLGEPIRFVSQQLGKLAFEAQYEPCCYLTGEVQTRPNNWHDLLNALVWLTFPRSKAAINARHYFSLKQNLSAEQLGSQRGATRDALTLLDESGVLVPYANAELAELLIDFQWQALFWQRRAELSKGIGFYLVGHGLYEKALHPYLGFTGQALLLPVQAEFFSWPLAQRLAHLDALLAHHLADDKNMSHPLALTPLPLLGIPGWSAENESATYYQNKQYFRDKRQKVNN
jgi:hypothetical protein